MYKVTKPVPPTYEQARAQSQERHARVQELLDTTLTLSEAAERYDVSKAVLITALPASTEWQTHYPNAPRRFYIRDIEAVAEQLQGQQARHTSHGDMARPLWFLDDTR